MTRRRADARAPVGLLLGLMLVAPGGAAKSPPIVAAVEIARHAAPEAHQGVAIDAEHFYAISNHTIVRHRRASGAADGRFEGGPDGAIRHLNSCYATRGELRCANSNYPDLPMASSVEVFDTRTLGHLRSRSLGMRDGSLTWFDRHEGAWWAGFAHYDGRGGAPDRDHRHTNVARFDDEWRLLEQWLLPESVLERLAPHGTSGGAFGPDGYLYVSGHDRGELYVLEAPRMGPTLHHVATVAIDIEGQAFAWERAADVRVIWGISRSAREVRAFSVPSVVAPAAAGSSARVQTMRDPDLPQ